MANPTADWRLFQVEQSGGSTGHCDCCGTTTKRVWGIVERDGIAVAAYFVGWTVGKPDHGATFDLILGEWGEGATAQNRSAVALDFRANDGSHQFMVVDAKMRITSGSDLADRALARSDVIGNSLAPQVFAVVDAVYFGDQALDELRQWT